MFEILPHLADVAVRATGETTEELLQALLQGMFAIAEPRWGGGQAVERPFTIISHDPIALIVDFLSEALAQSDINKEAYTDVRFSSVTEMSAKGIFIGKSVTGFETQIKAVTYHNLEIRHLPDGMFETVVTFDV